jgi:hypothetical protein
LGYAGNLAVAASHNSTTSSHTISSLDKVLGDALKSVDSAVTSVKQLATVDSSAPANDTSSAGKFAVVGIDGIDIMTQSL